MRRHIIKGNLCHPNEPLMMVLIIDHHHTGINDKFNSLPLGRLEYWLDDVEDLGIIKALAGSASQQQFTSYVDSYWSNKPTQQVLEF